MTLQQESYEIEYLVKAMDDQRGAARILAHDSEVGSIARRSDYTFLLAKIDNEEWVLDPRVHGEIRPFSMSVRKDASGDPILTIRDHLFHHHGRFYIFGSIPEGRAPSEFLIGRRYISRLDNLPHSDLADVDQETRNRLRRAFRGILVGEFGGLGRGHGHLVRLSRELEDIGLPLAACSYLLFSTP